MRNKNSLFARPASAYFLILGSVSILSALGIIMVLSASSVKALNESGNSFAIVFRQVIFLGLSLLVTWLAMNLKESLWRPQARLALGFSAIFLMLPQVSGLGKTVGGNTNWIQIGSLSIQPSEFAKFGLILWCASRLRTHDQKMTERGVSNPLPLVAPGIGLILALVMWGRDLGTAAVIAGIVGGMLFIAGMQTRYFATLLALGIVVISGFVVTNPNRMGRFSAFWDPFSEANYKSAGWQQAHSIMGLASGGPLGTGLGSSKQKWGNLPEAHTDFIFAVIGEELGLLGTLTVLILYAILILGIFRVALRATNNFDRYVTAGIGCWIAVQVILNIGTVISVMPVVGVTLPFISYGGSSLLASFVAIGYVLGVLRRDPEIAHELRARRVAKEREDSQMAKRIVLAGGGTAGHIEPALAVADSLRRKDPTINIEFIGTASGLENLLVPQRGYRLRTIPKVVLPRRFAITSLIFPIAIIRSLATAKKILTGADLLIGFGGYVSASAYLGARLARVPIVIHEANAKPGWANKLGQRLASLSAVNFADVQKQWSGSVLTGMPIRNAISELAKLSPEERMKFRELHAKSFGLDASRPIIALFGGSQGSSQMNQAIAGYLEASSQSGVSPLQIIHAVGINNPLPDSKNDYLPMAYFHDMAAIYGVADLLVTRSGAVTCSELMTVGRFAILVPLPHGNGEQVDNAQALVDQNRAVMVRNEEFTSEWLLANLAKFADLAKGKEIAPVPLHLHAADRIAELALSKLLSKEAGAGS